MMFPENISKEEVNQLPLGKYEGPITVVDSKTALHRALRAIERSSFIGFDTETKPAFQKGVYHQVALLQLALADQVFLIRLSKIGFPTALRELFSESGKLKVGISIRDDLVELQKLANFRPHGIVELNEIAKDLGVLREGVRNLTATFLGFRISKSQQTTNWERDQLTEKQMYYAATDAWVCHEIYQKLFRQGYL
ncbi:MAG: 3'-5' exonuclease domain-containing protein 2 [Cyclobacteriaceae bacterium]|nr:3'-5' exonuclease domain-containing protein 2 [Cyclobacteriaceae bacterium]